MNSFLFALLFGPSFTAAARASDYASEISADPANERIIRGEGRRPSCPAAALTQAQPMASTGSVTHDAGGNFSTRVAPLRKSRAAENIGAGFDVRRNAEAVVGFARPSREFADAGRAPRRLASVDNPKSPYRKFWAMVITD